jgi:hypothetical protein
MRKVISCLTVLTLGLLLISSAVHGGWGDLPKEGTQVVEKSKFMIDEGQKMVDVKNPTRAELGAQGQEMIKQGMNAINTGTMMHTKDGKKNMQSVSQKLIQGGNLLVTMSKQEGELTQQEKDKIKKQGENLISFGKLMLNKGQNMGGN